MKLFPDDEVFGIEKNFEKDSLNLAIHKSKKNESFKHKVRYMCEKIKFEFIYYSSMKIWTYKMKHKK